MHVSPQTKIRSIKELSTSTALHFISSIQCVMDEYIHGCIHGEHIVSKQVNAVMSLYPLSPEGHHSAMESLPRPNQ